MKTVAIIQARMGSERLPGKVLKVLGTHSLLGHVIKRVKRIKKLDDLVIATTKLTEDKQIIKTALKYNVRYFRGSENNVLERFYQAAYDSSADVIIRITADCPLLDPSISEKVLFPILQKKYDYSCNTQPATFPDGMDTEAFTFETLKKVYYSSTEDYQKEHVTPLIYENPKTFNIYNYKSEKDLSKYRFVIDNEDDFHFLQSIYDILGNDFYEINHFELVKLIINNTKLNSIKLSGRRNEKFKNK
tara:strand:+ start:590 stop:1327 length:738 start_codon:yes stop_codon:yes gene_type:complete